jgi:hypothetical protein
MKKFFTKMSLMAAFVLGVTALNAQKVIWPVATDSATIKASQFADTTQIYQATAAAPTAPAGFKGWTTTGVAANARFRWSRDGKAAENSGWAGFMGAATFLSPTFANGSAVLSAQFLNGGVFRAFINSELISPTINAAGQKDLTVQFSQAFYLWNAETFKSAIKVTWSEDDGLTWKTPIRIVPTVNSTITLNGASTQGDCRQVDHTFESSYIDDITNIKLKGSVGTDKFKVKFIFGADGYWWMLDDVRVLSYDNDLRTNKDWFALPTNLVTPKSQVEPLFFLNDVSNQGTKAQPNSKVNITLRQAVTNTQVYSADLALGSMKPDTIIENKLITGSFTPPATVGVYTGRYRTSSDSTDQFSLNDSTRIVFAVSDSVFQKEAGGVFSTRPGDDNWAGTAPHSWSVGNHFYVVRGKNYKATKITARIGNSNNLIGKTMIAKLYSWKVPRVPIDSAIDVVKRADMKEVAGGEANIPTGSGTFAYLDIPLINLDPSVTGDIVKLKDTTHYLAVLEYLTSEASTTTTGNMTITFDTRFEYEAMQQATRYAGKSRFGSVLGIGTTGDLDIDPFGSDYVPVVRLTLGDLPNETKDILAADNKFSIYPNPASADIVSLNIDLTKASDVRIRVTSIDGKVVSEQGFEAIKNDRIDLSVKNLAAGIYFVQLQTELGSRTERLVIAK